MEMTLQHEYTTYDELREFLMDAVFGMKNIPDVMTVQMSEDSARRFSQDVKDIVKPDILDTEKEYVYKTNIVKIYNRTLKIEVI